MTMNAVLCDHELDYKVSLTICCVYSKSLFHCASESLMLGKDVH